MLRVDRPNCPSRRLARAGLLSVSVLVIGLAALAPARAQAQSPLRGEITEEQANEDLLLRRTPGTARDAASADQAGDNQSGTVTRTQSDDYEPISPGALTPAETAGDGEQDTDRTIADETATPESNDPFADSTPIPSPRPRKGRAGQQPDSDAPTDAGSRTARAPQTAAERRQPRQQADDVTTGTTRTPTVDSDDREALTLDRGAERERAIEGLVRKPDEKPFDPVGIRAGTFILRPSFEQGLTYTTNANASPDGSEAILSESTLRLNAVSDWAENQATIDAYGTFSKSLSGEKLKQKEGGIAGTLDYDLSHEFRLKTAAGYVFKPESASSPVMLGNVVEQPLRQTFNASVGISKELGKLELGATAKAERNMYGDADLDTGVTLDQKERNYAYGAIALRGGYEISPAIKPFVELELGRQNYDQKFDSAGYQRSGDRLAARAGLTLDMREKLTGEFSAGWLRQGFDDDQLGAISGLALAADLRWSPERDTTIGLDASTTIEGTTTAGDSGSLLHSGTLTMERLVRSNLTANAALGVGYRTYNGTGDHDLILSGEAGATWWLNRYLGLTGRLRHEQQTSDLPGRNYKTDSVFVGVKVQR